MRGILFLLLGVSTLLIAPPSVTAQDVEGADDRDVTAPDTSSDQKSTTLSDVIHSVKKHHPKLVSALLELEAAEAKLLSSRGRFDPKLRLDSGWYGSGFYEGTNSTASELAVPLETASSEVFLGLRSGHGNFPVYEDEYDTLDVGEIGGGLRFSLLRDREIDKRRAELAIGQLRIQEKDSAVRFQELFLLEKAAFAFWAWKVNVAQVEVFKKLLAVSQTRQSQFDERVRLGQMARVDALDNSRAILNRREKLIEQEQKLRRAAQKLSIFLRDEAGEVVLPKIAKAPKIPTIRKSLPRSLDPLDQLIEQRPDVLVLLRKRKQVENQVRLQENQILPELNIETSVTRDYGDGEESREGTEWKSLLRFEMPFYQREARGKVAALKREIGKIDQELRLLKDNVKADWKALEQILVQSHDRYAVLRQEVDVAEQLERAEWERFNAGTSNLLIVAIREIATATVRTRKLQSLLENRAAFLRLGFLAGKTDFFEVT